MFLAKHAESAKKKQTVILSAANSFRHGAPSRATCLLHAGSLFSAPSAVFARNFIISRKGAENAKV